MTLWLIIAVMTAVAAVVIAWPLLVRRARAAAPGRDAYDVAIYREQLGELRQDVARGILNAGEEAAARLEIHRRLLRAAEAGEARGGGPRGGTMQAIVAALLLAFVPGFALGLYLWRGAPEVPSQSAADRAAASVAMPDAPAVDPAVAGLAARLEREPNDLDGWLLLGRSYVVLGRYDEAVGAYERARALALDNVGLWGALAESMVLAADGTVTPTARQLFDAILAKEPTNPAARFYAALAAAEAGDQDAAFAGWLALARDAPDDAPWLPAVIDQLRALAPVRGVDLAELLPPGRLYSKPAATAPVSGPNADDMAAAADMAPEDREAMIRGMVAQLAERLEGAPDDVEGWLRLARSYEILNEVENARSALARAAALRPDDIDLQARYGATLLMGADPDVAPPEAAIEVYRRVLAARPDDANALFIVGLADAHAGRREAAITAWDKLLRLLEPGSPPHREVTERLARLRSGR
ncbi:MAG: c-type cytochrome biogenesis protein CcmI [Alphaproteobacteria bacterium]|nr:c-type cytochrome biogenesis protein CcmI [Alphaproteobacteria bacterium]